MQVKILSLLKFLILEITPKRHDMFVVIKNSVIKLLII